MEHTHTHFHSENQTSHLDQMDMTWLSREMGFLKENFWGFGEKAVSEICKTIYGVYSPHFTKMRKQVW